MTSNVHMYATTAPDKSSMRSNNYTLYPHRHAKKPTALEAVLPCVAGGDIQYPSGSARAVLGLKLSCELLA
jgi:hypothetical protein